MICGHCQVENAEGRRFCRDCGVTLVASCTHCSFVNGLCDRYCGGCGVEMEVGRASKKPQPRTLAVEKPVLHAVPDFDIDELMPAPVTPEPTTQLPAQVSQADLDRLFESAKQ